MYNFYLLPFNLKIILTKQAQIMSISTQHYIYAVFFFAFQTRSYIWNKLLYKKYGALIQWAQVFFFWDKVTGAWIWLLNSI